MSRRRQMHVAVVGAGAFGGWTALRLQEQGARVTLIDMAQAGHPLSSSGGESRVIRHVYPKRIYVDLAARALALWQQADRDWGQQLFHPRGVLFMSGGGEFIDRARRHMSDAGIGFEVLGQTDLKSRYPQINTDGIDQAVFEPSAGFLDANRSCAVVRRALLDAGGSWLTARVRPGPVKNDKLQGLLLPDQSILKADCVVFACGPWMKELFSEHLSEILSITRQEVYFFRIPGEQRQILGPELPVWADVGSHFWYGIPGSNGLFKVADDTHGPEVDPDTQSREPSATGVSRALEYMSFRFPGMAGARLADARVCQYSVTAEHDFIIDWQPGLSNVLLMTGGSGHGFKHGPAIGELAAGLILEKHTVPAAFCLDKS